MQPSDELDGSQKVAQPMCSKTAGQLWHGCDVWKQTIGNVHKRKGNNARLAWELATDRAGSADLPKTLPAAGDGK